MKPLHRRKRFWALMGLLGVAVLVIVLVALRKKKGREKLVTRLVPPTTTAKANSTGTSDGVVFRPLSLDMIKDSPSMAMMFLLEKVYSDDNPSTPLPSKELLRTFLDFEYGDVTESTRRVYDRVKDLLKGEREIKDLVEELKEESKLVSRSPVYFRLPYYMHQEEYEKKMEYYLGFFRDLTVFDPVFESGRLSDYHYSILMNIIRFIYGEYGDYEEEQSKQELEMFIINDTKEIFEFIRLSSQKNLLVGMCGVNFDGLSIDSFRSFFVDFVNRPRAGPWIINNVKLLNSYQAKLFVPYVELGQLFSKNDVAKMATTIVSIDRRKSSILNSLCKHLKIHTDNYFGYFLSELLKDSELPEKVFNFGDFVLPTEVGALTRISYYNFPFEYIISCIEDSQSSYDLEFNWRHISMYPDDRWRCWFWFSFDLQDLDSINHGFSLGELNELREAYSKHPTRAFSEAQKQRLIEVYNASKSLLDQTNYKPYFEDIGHLRNWPLFLLTTNLIILLSAKASIELFTDTNLNILDYYWGNENHEGLICCPEGIANSLEGIWDKIDIRRPLKLTKEYYEYTKGLGDYLAQYNKFMELYSYVKANAK